MILKKSALLTKTCFVQSLTFDSLHRLVWLMRRLVWNGQESAWHSYTLLFHSLPHTPTHAHQHRQKQGSTGKGRRESSYLTLTHYSLPLLPHIQLGLFIWDFALYPHCSIDFCCFQTVGHDCSLVPFCFYILHANASLERKHTHKYTHRAMADI